MAIRSVLLYGFPIWFSISPVVAMEMEIFERKVLRKCVNKNYQNPTKRYSNASIYNAANIQPLCEYAMHHLKSFSEKLLTHEDSLLSDVFNAEKNIHWSESTYLLPIAILNENISHNTDQNALPQFYVKTSPGSHRG